MHVCVWMLACVDVYVGVCVYVRGFACICVCVCVCVCLRIRDYMNVCVHLHVYMDVCVLCAHACVH